MMPTRGRIVSRSGRLAPTPLLRLEDHDRIDLVDRRQPARLASMAWLSATPALPPCTTRPLGLQWVTRRGPGSMAGGTVELLLQPLHLHL